MCLRLSYMKKNVKKIFFCILKVTEERSRIRKSEERIRGSVSRFAQKCHGSPTLIDGIRVVFLIGSRKLKYDLILNKCQKSMFILTG